MDGPFAFSNPKRGQYGYDGMTLRDWFAGHALAGIVSTTTDDFRDATDWSSEARDAYDAADAMLAARSAPPEPKP